MVFSSVIFVFYFLPFALLWTFGFHYISANLISKKSATEVTNFNLTIISLVFYAWGELENIWILLASATITYIAGILIRRYQSKNALKCDWIVTLLGVSSNLGFLLYFKYYDFSVSIFSADHLFGANVIQSPIPLGISFFTFQCISYLLDIHWRKDEATHNPVKFFCYLTFFPQLIAGPIVRYASVSYDLANRSINVDQVYEGIRRFAIGLSKKTLVANPIGKLSDDLFSLPASELTTLSSWLAAICYGLQILFDFSGYSDMAIGLGKVFGINIPENFRQPYQAKSIRDFWRRWHISLSTWFRDYLYIPLGGNRTSKWRNGLNLLIVFFLCGLWHGASFNFIAWGLLHGLFLCVERLVSDRSKRATLLVRPFRRIYTLMVVFSSWILFRSESLEQAGSFYKSMFIELTYSPLLPKSFFSYETQISMLAALLIALSSDIITNIWRGLIPSKLSTITASLLPFALLSASLLKIIVSTYDPFIYFRF